MGMGKETFTTHGCKFLDVLQFVFISIRNKPPNNRGIFKLRYMCCEM
jgi:hypothetical protein